jgi:hypothetical protein
MSFHLALGNHDHRQNFLAAFPDAKSAASEKDEPDKYRYDVWPINRSNNVRCSIRDTKGFFVGDEHSNSAQPL